MRWLPIQCLPSERNVWFALKRIILRQILKHNFGIRDCLLDDFLSQFEDGELTRSFLYVDRANTRLPDGSSAASFPSKQVIHVAEGTAV